MTTYTVPPTLRHTPLQLVASLPVTASAGARTIDGDIVEYNVVGITSAGPTIYLPGSLEVPAELERVKLLEQHDSYSAAVGVMTALTDSADKARASFTVPEGERGDVALANAANGLRDGLSVGTTVQEYSWDDAGNLIVHRAQLREVSLVTIPAYTNAGVTSVAANRRDTPAMTRDQLTDAPPAGGSGVTPPAAVAAANAPAPLTYQAPAATVEAQAPAPTPLGRTASRGMDLQAAAGRILEELRNGNTAGLGRALGSVITLEAANGLQDIVPAHDGAEQLLAPQFIGELWQAARTDRPVIESLGTPERLTSLYVDSWEYVPPVQRNADGTPKLDAEGAEQADTAAGTTAGPEVREYAGNKALIHSNRWETRPARGKAYRNAGGWDFDRAYVDFGVAGFIVSVLRKATDDSRSDAERYVLERLLEAATVVAPQTSVTGALATLGTQAAGLGARIDYVSMAADVWGDFVNLSADEVPWWLQRQGELNLGTTSGNAGGIGFSVNPELASGAIIAGDRRGATFYEVNPPIAVQALNVANGGVDLGVYGYCYLQVHDRRTILATTVA
jgi:HK97 family phage prohead protease